MHPEQSPFKPGQIVPFEFFVGRIEEIERLLSMVKASTQGQFKIGFISGERGIGKSSLASLVRHVSDSNHNTAGCHVHLGGVGELNEMVRTTFDRLLNESIDKSWHQQMKDFFGSRVQKVGLFGISLELNLTDKDLPVLSRNFVPSMKNLLDKLNEQKDALLLILDDINGLATSTDFANWLKSTVDEISTSGHKMPLCILVVGLEERRQELINCQPSLARVFDLINISPWADSEATDFYQRYFQSAGAKIEDTELEKLVSFTGGLPVLAHEIGDAVWRAAKNLEITPKEVNEGIATAAEIIGRKFLEPQIFRAIQSEKYRSILRKIASEFDTVFLRSELVASLTGQEAKVIDSFLRRMKHLGAIESVEGVKGGYKFPNRLHELYFWMESQMQKTP